MRIPTAVLYRCLLVTALSVVPGRAQLFSAGVKVGLPLTDFIHTVETGTTTTTNRYLVGPTAELHLPFGFGLEADALYRHFSFTNVVSSGATALTDVNTAGEWEFPLLVKYRFHGKLARPYVDAGVAWDTLRGLTSTVRSVTGSSSHSSSANESTTMGAVLGAGIDIHILVIHILPELRYTRWTDQHFTISNVLHSNQNQAEFMVGVTF